MIEYDDILTIRAQRDHSSFGISLHGFVGEFSSGQTIGVVKILEVEQVRRGSIRPTMASIETKEAQILMDDLWGCGIRPSEGTGSAGSLAATEKHLQDMRKIALDLLSISK